MISSIVFLCLQALIMQKISAQCIGVGYKVVDVLPGPSLPAPVWEGPICERLVGLTLSNLAASNCNGFNVRSISPIAPNGLFVTSDNVLEGFVSVRGALPFLSTVSLGGTLPSAGAGAIAYRCGTGDIGIMSEELGPYLGPEYVVPPVFATVPSEYALGYPVSPGCGFGAAVIY